MASDKNKQRVGLATKLVGRMLLVSSLFTLLISAVDLILDCRERLQDVDKQISMIEMTEMADMANAILSSEPNALDIGARNIHRLPYVHYVKLSSAVEADRFVELGQFHAKEKISYVWPVIGLNNTPYEGKTIGYLQVEAYSDVILSDSAAIRNPSGYAGYVNFAYLYAVFPDFILCRC